MTSASMDKDKEVSSELSEGRQWAQSSSVATIAPLSNLFPTKSASRPRSSTMSAISGQVDMELPPSDIAPTEGAIWSVADLDAGQRRRESRRARSSTGDVVSFREDGWSSRFGAVAANFGSWRGGVERWSRNWDGGAAHGGARQERSDEEERQGTSLVRGETDQEHMTRASLQSHGRRQPSLSVFHDSEEGEAEHDPTSTPAPLSPHSRVHSRHDSLHTTRNFSSPTSPQLKQNLLPPVNSSRDLTFERVSDPFGTSELDADAVDNALLAEQHQYGLFAMVEKALEWVGNFFFSPFPESPGAD